MCNLSILSLNYLWGDCPVKPTFSAAQVRVHNHVESSVFRMFGRLSEKAARIREKDDATQHPSLVAALVDMGPVACTCDAQAFVSDDLRSQIVDGGGLFRDVASHRSTVPRYSGKDRAEYAKITVRGLLNGKLRLRSVVSGGGTVFAVNKPSGGQREVWHGRYVSSLAPTPPKPRHQPTPSCLLDLEAGPTRPLFFSKRDAVSYFD
jgi:hypothetical protein